MQHTALVSKTKKVMCINDNYCQLKLSINVNSRIGFVFAQKNAAHCIGEQNKKKVMCINDNGCHKTKTKLIV